MAQVRRYSKKNRVLMLLACIAVPLFLFLSLYGSYGSNGHCYRYLGCNTGFFGYDMAVHFLSGIADAALAILLMREFPSLNLLTKYFWKDLLSILSVVVFIAFLWEFAEFCWDYFRILILHMDLAFPNKLYQPSNEDTMGDMLVAIIGALLVAPAFFAWRRRRE